MKQHILLAIFLFSLIFPDVGSGNSVSASRHNFVPNMSGTDFITVEPATTLPQGTVHASANVDTAVNSDPIHQPDQSSRQNHGEINDTVTGAHLSLGLGLTKHLEFAVSVPWVVSNSHFGTSEHKEYEDAGYTEIRGSIKFQPFLTATWKHALVITGAWDQTRYSDDLGAETPPNRQLITVMYATSYQVGPLHGAGNLGYGKFMGANTKLASPLYLGSLALALHLESLDTNLIAEAFASVPDVDPDLRENRLSESAEFLVGFKKFYSQSLGFHWGIGGELLHGRDTPDWRMVLGINTWLRTQGTNIPSPKIVRTSSPETISPVPYREIEFEVEPDFEISLEQVFFNFDSARLKQSSLPILDDLLVQIASSGNVSRIVVEGHTCSIGDEEYNWDLSSRRARSVVNYLNSHWSIGTKPQFKVAPQGESTPMVSNATWEGRRQNRRVVFKVFLDTKVSH